MNWRKALNHSVFDSRAEAEIKAFNRASIPEFIPPTDKKRWLARASRLRRQALEKVFLNGYPQEAIEQKPKVVWGDVLQTDSVYRIRKFRFEAYPDYWIPALLYEPQNERGRLPVVLNTMGHALTGKGDAHMQIRCANLARRGILAVNMEFIGMGELSADVYHNRQAYLNLTGMNGAGLMVLALQKCLDVVLAHQQADRRRVAVTGLSGGGWQAIVLSALDRRVTVGVPVAGYTSMAMRNEVCEDIGDLEQVPVDLMTVLGYQEMTAMVAPRPLLQILNEHDDCCFVTARTQPEIVDAIRPVYEAFGVADRLAFHNNTDPGTHNYDADNRQQLYRFLNLHFKLSAPLEDIHTTTDVWDYRALDVGLPAVQESFLTLARKRAYALCEVRKSTSKPADRARLRKELRKVLRLPSYNAKAELRCCAGNIRQFAVTLAGWTVPVTAWMAEDGACVELGVADAGRTAFDEMPNADGAVYAADIFDTGENRYSFGRKMITEACGHRLLGIQVAQILALAAWISDSTGGPLRLRAKGYNTTTAAMLAVALEPKRFVGLQLDGYLRTLTSLIDWAERVPERHPLFCYGLLEVCDLPDLLPLLDGVALATDR